MNQRQRMNSTLNAWEADPWDAPDEVANAQLAGFQLLSDKPVAWQSVRQCGSTIFGREIQTLIDADVEFYATHDGEDMLLMQLTRHGFPDPPEWRLATRTSGHVDEQWSSWGYFTELPQAWNMPEEFKR